MSKPSNNALAPKEVKRFEDTAGVIHESKLSCLMANKRFAVRAIIQNHPNGGRVNLTPNDVLLMVMDSAEQVTNAMKKFDVAINRERSKANPIPASME